MEKQPRKKKWQRSNRQRCANRFGRHGRSKQVPEPVVGRLDPQTVQNLMLFTLSDHHRYKIAVLQGKAALISRASVGMAALGAGMVP